MNWNDLRFFLAVARAGSLSAAALTLKTTPSRVSRRVEALEAALSMTLFLRSLDGYRLTDEGRDMLARAEAVETAALAVTGKAAFRSDTAGRVRLATAENLAVHLIMPALTRFRARYPHIQIDVLTGVWSLDLNRFEADVALRLTRPDSGNVKVRRLGHMACAVYRAREGDAAGSGFAGWLDDAPALPATAHIAALQADVSLRANSLAVHHAAAAAGAARAVLPCFIGDRDTRLRRDGGPVKEAGQDIWLVINKDIARAPRVRAVADFLAGLVTRHAATLRGVGA